MASFYLLPVRISLPSRARALPSPCAVLTRAPLPYWRRSESLLKVYATARRHHGGLCSPGSSSSSTSLGGGTTNLRKSQLFLGYHFRKLQKLPIRIWWLFDFGYFFGGTLWSLNWNPCFRIVIFRNLPLFYY